MEFTVWEESVLTAVGTTMQHTWRLRIVPSLLGLKWYVQVVLHGWGGPTSIVVTEWIRASFPGMYVREVCMVVHVHIKHAVFDMLAAIVCMCVCIYIYIYIYIYILWQPGWSVCTYVCMLYIWHAQIMCMNTVFWQIAMTYMYMCMYICTYVFVCMYICVDRHTNVCKCVCVCVCVCSTRTRMCYKQRGRCQVC